MHARLDQLLSLRDGEPVDARVKAHVDDCADCAAALGGTRALRERLRALPQVNDDVPDGWADVQIRRGVRRHRARRLAGLAPVAAAASVAALGLVATVRLLEAPSAPAPVSLPSAREAVDPIEDLRAQSRALEELLAALPARPAVERAGTSLPIDTLETQVQWLDHQLTLAGTEGRVPDAEQLWRDRVEAMNSLVRLRYVEAQQVML